MHTSVGVIVVLLHLAVPLWSSPVMINAIPMTSTTTPPTSLFFMLGR